MLRLVGLLLALAFSTTVGQAAEVKVLSGSALDPVFPVLVPQFEAASGHKVVLDSNGAVGFTAERVRKGEAADTVIVSRPQIDALAAEGKVLPASGVTLAKLGVGVFVRQGAPKPDIGTVDAFRQAMIQAKSIGYNDPAAGAPVGLYLLDLFERMGMTPVMQPKTVVFKQRSERFAPVARGEVEIGFNQISEILAASGVDLVAPLPPGIQNYTVFAAGVVAAGRETEAGRAFVRFMASPAALAVMRAKGFEAP